MDKSANKNVVDFISQTVGDRSRAKYMQKSITMRYAGFGEIKENSDDEENCAETHVRDTSKLTDADRSKNLTRELTKLIGLKPAPKYAFPKNDPVYDYNSQFYQSSSENIETSSKKRAPMLEKLLILA